MTSLSLGRLVPNALAFFASVCLMILELMASRLVARHVGSSLTVWTSVIGIVLFGICLGNALGGRLADRIKPRLVIGPLLALASMLTLLSLWINAMVAAIPGQESLPWSLRTVLIVGAEFLIPSTILGMISPVVAKLAVMRSSRSGTAIGNVYFWGAVGSIVGTFLAGFVLIPMAPTSEIVTLVAAGLAALASTMLMGRLTQAVGLICALSLTVGALDRGILAMGLPKPPEIPMVSGLRLDPWELIGHAMAWALAGLGVVQLLRAARIAQADLEAETLVTETRGAVDDPAGTSEAIAGVTRSDAGTVEDGNGSDSQTNATPLVELEGIAEVPTDEPAPAEPSKPTTSTPRGLWDLALYSLVISLAFMSFEMVAGRLVTRHLGASIYGWTSVIGVLLAGLSVGNWFGGQLADRIRDEKAISWLLLVASIGIASVLLVEKQPILGGVPLFEHINQYFPRESLFDTALTTDDSLPWPWRVAKLVGLVFFLPSVTLGLVSPVASKLAVDRRLKSGRTGSALGLVYACGMVGSLVGTFLTGFVLIGLLGTKGVLIALATLLALCAVVSGGLAQALWAGVMVSLSLIAFLPIEWANRRADYWGLADVTRPLDDEALAEGAEGPVYQEESNYFYLKVDRSLVKLGELRQLILDNLIHGYVISGHPEHLEYEYEHLYAQATSRYLARRGEDGPFRAMFLGGGSYTFPRYLRHVYDGVESEVAEIDPAVLRINQDYLGLDDETGIRTIVGDARQHVFRTRRDSDAEPFHIVYGDAFNDFSVPWHLTTREFNEAVFEILDDDGLYIINIIDIFLSDEEAQARSYLDLRERVEAEAREALLAENAEATPAELDEASDEAEVDPSDLASVERRALNNARSRGGFLGAWVATARQTFPHVYVFGSASKPGSGIRETFVVIAAKAPLDLEDLGRREGDPQFELMRENAQVTLQDPYSPALMEQLRVRSRGIILTDDYAPVDNLLAPVARSRSEL